jgi:epsin
MAGPAGALDKLKSVDWRGLVRTATNKAKMYVLNLSPLEVLVEEATNTETWGPHGSAMAEIAEACFDPEGYRQVLGVLARRLQEGGERWRCAYKALLLLEHLVKHGPAKAAADVAASRSVLERLQKFEHKDANGRDHGANVRHRAAEIAALVASPQRVAEEREKAAANKAKYTGASGGASRSASGFGGAPGGGGAPRRFDPASLVRPGGATGGAAGGAYDAGGGGGGGYRGGGGGYGGGGGGRDSGAVDEWGRSPQSSAPPRPPAAEARDSSGAAASPRGADPVAATRARIEKLKLSEAAGARAADGASAPPPRKLLADVRVNPKIAASLGLKLPAPAAPRAAGAVAPQAATPAAAPAAAGGADLLGGLLDTPPAASAAGGAAAAWDPFGAGPAPLAAPAAPAAPAARPAPGGGPAAGARPALGGGGGAFADLTGLHKTPVAMGARASPRTSPGGAPAPAAAAAAAPPPAFAADFGAAFAVDFGAAAPPKAAGVDPFADLLG